MCQYGYDWQDNSIAWELMRRAINIRHTQGAIKTTQDYRWQMTVPV